MTPGTKAKIRNQIVRLLEYILNWPRLFILLAVLLAALATIDVLDLSLHERWPALLRGWFYRDQTDTFFSFIGNTLLLMAFAAALLANREARRGTSFELRPYMRIEWVSDPEPNDRQGQGIRNTCLVLINNGNGLMRNIRYDAYVGGEKVPVRNHSLITTGGHPTKVVYVQGFMDSPLGDRDSIGTEVKAKNDEIVRAGRVAIMGTYEDVDGHTSDFSFESDSSQQSWFREMDFQHQRTLVRKIVWWFVMIFDEKVWKKIGSRPLQSRQ
ncbi:MAG: hypothetical protein HY372_01130 [Candidatus Andersenbacteria bacterium]|nr:hypothetical protein [Candidatus Andersenbacteria bacterium]